MIQEFVEYAFSDSLGNRSPDGDEQKFYYHNNLPNKWYWKMNFPVVVKCKSNM